MVWLLPATVWKLLLRSHICALQNTALAATLNTLNSETKGDNVRAFLLHASSPAPHWQQVGLRAVVQSTSARLLHHDAQTQTCHGRLRCTLRRCTLRSSSLGRLWPRRGCGRHHVRALACRAHGRPEGGLTRARRPAATLGRGCGCCRCSHLLRACFCCGIGRRRSAAGALCIHLPALLQDLREGSGGHARFFLAPLSDGRRRH
jgi:hypothetical protein